MSDYFFLFRSIMASADLCELCLVNSEISLVAKMHCSACEEQLCEECAESHLRSKALKYHHVIYLSSVGSSMSPSSKINCEIHTDVHIDYFVVNMMLYDVELVFRRVISLVKLLYH